MKAIAGNDDRISGTFFMLSKLTICNENGREIGGQLNAIIYRVNI